MKIKKIIFLINLLIFIFIYFGFVDAASFPYWKSIMSCNTQRNSDGSFADPCKSLCDILATTKNAIYFGITLALFVIAPLAFLIGGIILIISRGNEGMIKKGKAILTNALWGVVITLIAFTIVNQLLTLLASKSSNTKIANWSEIQCNPSELPGTIQY